MREKGVELIVETNSSGEQTLNIGSSAAVLVAASEPLARMDAEQNEMGSPSPALSMGPRAWRMVRDVAIAALVFQLVHFVEHVAQLSYWAMHTSSAPWLTPWAIAGRELLVVDGTPASGNELLHLVGNLIFLAGVLALVGLVFSARQSPGEIPFLKPALLLQGAHVIEHVLLTGTYLAIGDAVGFTTLFGLADGAFGSGLRVWAHFLLNLVATYFVSRAVLEMKRRGLLAMDSLLEGAAHVFALGCGEDRPVLAHMPPPSVSTPPSHSNRDDPDRTEEAAEVVDRAGADPGCCSPRPDPEGRKSAHE